MGVSFFFFLGYLFFSFTLLNYLLIRGIYFFSFSLLGQYYFALLVCFIYVLVFHEFSFLFLRCYFVSCLFLIPVVLSVQLGNLPLFEEVSISLLLLLVFA